MLHGTLSQQALLFIAHNHYITHHLMTLHRLQIYVSFILYKNMGNHLKGDLQNGI